MGNREIIFEEKQIYHILTRAVEKRKIFFDKADALRFIFQMCAANIGRPALNLRRRDVVENAESLLRGKEISSKLIIKEYTFLVHILSFSLVVDHYHFLLVQNINGGIPKFMQKLNTGFVKYFNLKNERKGALFESRYKAVPIKDEFQLDAVVRYINITNPLDVFQPGWRERGLKDPKAAFEFLNHYQFSSFPDLFGKRHSRILASKDVLEEFLGKDIIRDREGGFEFVKDYLSQNKIVSFPVFLE